MKKILLLLMMVAALSVLAACSGGTDSGADDSASSQVEPAMEETMSDDDMAGEDMSDSEMSDDEAMAHDDDMSDDEMKSDDEMMSDEGMSDDEMNSDDEMMSDDESMSDESMSDDDMMSDDEAMMDLPAWQEISLTNARTGEMFKLADFHGKTVFVEPMATWCTNCRQQLINVSQAKAELAGDEDVVFVALSLETNISDEELARYAQDHGFDWLFAVMSQEILQELVNTFGRSITSAPSTPHFVIRPDGSYTELVTGIEPAAQLVQQIQAAGS